MRCVYNNIWMFLTAAALPTAILTSCSSDDDAYDASAYQKNQTIKYEKSWSEAFGEIDPAQDWNIATQVAVNINVPVSGTSPKLMLFSSNPYFEDAVMYASISLPINKMSIDVPKGLTQVYAVVTNGETSTHQGYYNINNGKIYIDGNDVEKASETRATRAGDGCNVTIGEAIDLGTFANPIVHPAEYETLPWDGKTYVKWENNQIKYYILAEGGNYYFSTDNATWTKATFENQYYPELYFNGQPTGITANTDGSGLQYVGADTDTWNTTRYIQKKLVSAEWTETFTYGTIHELVGVEPTEGTAWKQGVGYGMFGTKKFRVEGQKYWEWDGFKTRENGYSIEQLEKGASVTTIAAGSLTLSYLYGATQNRNAFGYIYYKDGQDKDKAPRYVLVKDARPEKNIFVESWKGENISDNMALSRWHTYEYAVQHKDDTPYDWQITQNQTPQQQFEREYNKLYVGTDYKMVYFGENYDEPGTYEFPADVHIEFFVIGTGWNDEPNYKENLGRFNFGNPEMNKKMQHYCARHYDPNHGAVKGTTWMYGGAQFIGFEDGGGDEDLNDIVFMMNGNIDRSNIAVIPSDEPFVKMNSWIVACEDLGSTNDYDFNDVVFKVEHTPGNTTAYVTPLAAGGEFEAHITFNGEDLGEIHELLGYGPDENGKYPMIGTSNNGNEISASKIAVTVPSDFTMSSIEGSKQMGGFGIKVKVSDTEASVINGPSEGSTPQMFVVPGTWQWPTERTRIDIAYPNFKKWNADANTTDWYLKASDASKVYIK